MRLSKRKMFQWRRPKRFHKPRERSRASASSHGLESLFRYASFSYPSENLWRMCVLMKHLCFRLRGRSSTTGRSVWTMKSWKSATVSLFLQRIQVFLSIWRGMMFLGSGTFLLCSCKYLTMNSSGSRLCGKNPAGRCSTPTGSCVEHAQYLGSPLTRWSSSLLMSVKTCSSTTCKAKWTSHTRPHLITGLWR